MLSRGPMIVDISPLRPVLESFVTDDDWQRGVSTVEPFPLGKAWRLVIACSLWLCVTCGMTQLVKHKHAPQRWAGSSVRWDTRLALIEAVLRFQENREPCLEMHLLPRHTLTGALGYKQRMLWCVLSLQVLVNFFPWSLNVKLCLWQISTYMRSTNKVFWTLRNPFISKLLLVGWSNTNKHLAQRLRVPSFLKDSFCDSPALFNLCLLCGDLGDIRGRLLSRFLLLWTSYKVGDGGVHPLLATLDTRRKVS